MTHMLQPRAVFVRHFFFLDDEPNFRNFERPTSVARNS